MKKSLTLSMTLFFVLSVFTVAFAKKSPECKTCRETLKSCVSDAKKKPKKAKKAAVKACMKTAKVCKKTCTMPAEEPPPAEENVCVSSCNADFEACSGGASPDTELGAYCGQLKDECLTTCQ